jgi:uncharacterized protein (DUF1800 family)
MLLTASGFVATAGAQVDEEINKSVWKQKFGVLDAQMNEQPPYAGWLSQDADGDGINNRSEFVAGTNPFLKLPTDAHFRPPVVSAGPDTLSLTFPTVPGKFYGAESSMSLVDTWSKGSLPGVVGDGTTRTLVVPKSAGKFFHIAVTDQATQGDQVSDWAKHMLGLSPSAPITSQTSFTSNSLADSLETQNIVSIHAVDTVATQPTDGSAPAGDYGVLRVTRSGFMMLGTATVPLAKSGTAVEGVDIAPLPSSVTFPNGVNSVDVRIAPLFNASRTSPATAFLTVASPGSAGAGGNYTLGSPTSAGVTVYPSGNPTGTGLTATYYPGASSTYSSSLNFGELVGATYSYTRTNATTGTATITYSTSGTPATPYVVGATTALQFTSSNLGGAPFNALNTYTITATPTSTSFTVAITGTALPNSSSGNVSIGGFDSSVTRIDPVVDFNWGFGNPNGNSYINSDNYSVRWDGWLSPTTSGNYTFQLDADDKARVFVDFSGTGNSYTQILENGWDTAATGGFRQSSAYALNGPLTAGTRYPVRVEFVDTTGSAKCRFQWKSGSGSFANIPQANVFTDNTGTTTGWTTSFFNNPTFTAPAARVQTESAVTNGNNGDWLTGSPVPSIFHNNFSARWTGQVLPQYTQKYYFVGRVDDGVKIWVNNQLVVDRWPGGGVTDSIGSIDLQANVLYDIKMEYFEATGGAEAHLQWYSEDQAKQVIPANRLFPTQAAPPAITGPTDAVTILGASNPFSMNLTSSNGGTITASGLPPWLTLVNGVLGGTPPAAGIYQFTLTTTNGTGSSSVVMTLEVQATPGQLTRETWTSGVTGPAVSNAPWNTPPVTTDTVGTAEDTTAYADNTGKRLRGYFTAPTTGNYYFWIAASNTAELWISNDSEPVNKVRRASVTDSLPRTWDAQASQKSPWLSLTAGKKYYIEILHNTGTSVSPDHLAVAWFLDPTGNTVNPIANGCPPASATVGGILPGHVLSPWDNPPTTTIPGTLYVTNLQGVQGLSGITATGGAFLRVNGSTAVLQLNYSGLTSGATSRKIYNSSGTVLFDINAQEKNYPALKTSDGGYTWNMQASDITDLNNGGVYLGISTLNNPNGEIAGTFGKIAGSQTEPATPAYPSLTALHALHATSDAANSRFLTQATFGPSLSDMANVKAIGYRPWIENQFTTPATKNVPFILANLSADPQNTYGSQLMFYSWWKNSITAPDQLRQRAAFALSEILVVSDTGPLNNNGRVLADYYDSLLDNCFGNFRDILKQVTLSPAMGVYLDMRGNTAGNIATGQIPNENYAREILQLFSAGLYRTWPDGTLILNSKGNAIPTYGQDEISGYARVFTGWNWGQPLPGGRLPTATNPSANYLDPMTLIPTRHELGTKRLLDSVILPAATVTTSSTTLTDPASPYWVYDPQALPETAPNTRITNLYDINGLRDLEVTFDNIMANSAVGPYICRQLIQRLVTSHPKPEYVHRVVRAYNGEQNIDGIRTGVRGDMKDVFRAILLDYEARSTTAAADPKYGKQREPLLRLTGPARAFPAAPIPNSTYSQNGLQAITVTTPSPHRLVSGEQVRLSDFVDSGSTTTQVPTTQNYTIGNVTSNSFTVNTNGVSNNLTYTVSGSSVTVTSSGYAANDWVYLNFYSGGLAGGTFNDKYEIASATGTTFTVNLASTPASTTGGTCSIPRLTSGYNVTGSAGNQTITIQTSGNHNLAVNDTVYLKFVIKKSPLPAEDLVYTVTSIVGPNSFRVTPPTTITTGSEGSNSVTAFPLKGSHWVRSGTVTVDPSTWLIGYTQSNLNQTPLNSTTVFNFFYPDYQYPGPMAQAGMTTPEFQLTNDSNTMNLTNVITQGTLTNSTGNANGYMSLFGSNNITIDLAPYMTPAQTSDAGVPGLINTLAVLLTGDNLTSATRTIISNYVANTTNYPYTTPTATQMRDRVRAIVHLIVTSAEYAIQK